MSDAASYFIPARETEITTEIKRSRFIAQIAHCPGPEQAKVIIEQAQKKYPDARHHCWAYIACPPRSATAVRCFDAGEPSGTAGKPILNVLQHSHYGEIICVVSRYFGGIKLGAGGLIRAYSNSTQIAIEQLKVKEIVKLTSLQIQFPYCYESSIRHFLELQKISLRTADYQEKVIFDLELEHSEVHNTIMQLQNICKGQVEVLEHKS